MGVQLHVQVRLRVASTCVMLAAGTPAGGGRRTPADADPAGRQAADGRTPWRAADGRTPRRTAERRTSRQALRCINRGARALTLLEREGTEGGPSGRQERCINSAFKTYSRALNPLTERNASTVGSVALAQGASGIVGRSTRCCVVLRSLWLWFGAL